MLQISFSKAPKTLIWPTAQNRSFVGIFEVVTHEDPVDVSCLSDTRCLWDLGLSMGGDSAGAVASVCPGPCHCPQCTEMEMVPQAPASDVEDGDAWAPWAATHLVQGLPSLYVQSLSACLKLKKIPKSLSNFLSLLLNHLLGFSVPGRWCVKTHPPLEQGEHWRGLCVLPTQNPKDSSHWAETVLGDP